jgi:chemotaxis protein methyltransferase CheR
MAISAGTFTYVANLVNRCSGLELTVGKEYLVESRLSALAREAGLEGVDEYVDTLRTAPARAEHDRVVEALTTNETSWFRDFTPFQSLTEHVVPALARDRQALTALRVWSAGCASGQEPYSIVMALLDAAPGLRVDITATDISQEALTRARAGRYNQIEMNRGLPVAMLLRHFVRVGTEWEVSEQVRSRVTFSRHNLLGLPPAGGPFDIIFLRNVLIYFGPETRREVLRRVRTGLRYGGYLFLGAAESTLGLEDTWERLPIGRGSVYRVNPRGAA